MSTTIEPQEGSPAYVEYDEYIEFQLSKTQSQIKRTELLTSSAWMGIGILSYLLTFVVLDQWLIPGGFGRTGRIVWFIGLISGGGFWLVWRVLLPWTKQIHELYAANMIERSDPRLKSTLLNLVDLQLNGSTTGSPVVRKSMEKRAAVQLTNVDVDHAIDRRALTRLAYVLLAIIVVCGGYVAFSPKDALTSVQRLFLPVAKTQVATRTTISNITPEDTKIVAGETLLVEADILGQTPQLVTLFYSTADQEFLDQPLEMQRVEEGAPRYQAILGGDRGRGVMQPLTYRIEAGDARTRDYRVDVAEPPSAKVEQVAYSFPAYMKLDAKTIASGNIDGWEGSKVIVSATTNVAVSSALVVLTDDENPRGKGEEIRMSIKDGKHLTAEWNLEFRSDGTYARFYHIDCITESGESDPHPVVQTIKIKDDQRPEVALLHPSQDLERPANAIVPLLIKASDPDFQLRFVTLKVEKSGEEIHSASLLDEEAQQFEGTHDLKLEQLADLGLKPGEEILYWIEARDNKQPHGNRSTTPRLKIKITTPGRPEDIAQQLNQDRIQQQEQLAEANSEKNQDGREEQQQQEGEHRPRDQRPEKSNKDDPDQENPKGEDPDSKPRPENGSDSGTPSENSNQDKEEADGMPPQADQTQTNQKTNRSQNAPSETPRKPEKDETKPEPGESRNDPSGMGDETTKGEEGKQNPADNSQPGTRPKTGEKETTGRNSSNSKSKNGPRDGTMDNTGKQPPEGAADTEGSSASNQKSPPDKPRNSNDRTSNEKKGPADDQTALQKLIENQQKREPNDSQTAQPDPESSDSKTADNASKDQQESPDSKRAQQNSPTNQKTRVPNRDQNQPNKDETSPGREDTHSDPKNSETGKQPSGKDEPGKKIEQKDPEGNRKQSSDPGRKPETGRQNPEDGKSERNSDSQSPDSRPNPSSDDLEMKDNPKSNSEGSSKKATDRNSQIPMNQAQNPDSSEPKSHTRRQEKPGAESDKNSSSMKSSEPGSKGQKSDKPKDALSTNEKSNQEGGEKTGEKPDPETPAQKGNAGDSKSNEMPTESDPSAVKKSATGDESGMAEGQEKPEGDAPRSKGELEKKPNSKQGATRPSREQPKPDSPQEKGRSPDARSEQPQHSSENADRTKTKSDGSKQSSENQNSNRERSSNPKEKRPGDASSQDEPNPGKGRPNQKSQRPDSGEEGGGTPQEQGTEGGKQHGQGDESEMPGEQSPDARNTRGKEGEQSGKGTQQRPSKTGQQSGKSEKKDNAGSGAKSPEKSEGESSSEEKEGEPSNKQGGAAGKQEGTPSGKSGENAENGQPGEQGKPTPNGKSQSGKGNPSGSRAPGSGQGERTGESPDGDSTDPGTTERSDREPDLENLPPAERDQAAQAAEEKANEEFARRASNLVLRKLKKDLERGETDQKLLDELGWTREDMERFVKRLERQLEDNGDDMSPESVARRRQFEETLKTLGLSNRTNKRTAKSGKTTRVNEAGDRKIPVPAEYRELFEEYTKDLAKPANSK